MWIFFLSLLLLSIETGIRNCFYLFHKWPLLYCSQFLYIRINSKWDSSCKSTLIFIKILPKLAHRNKASKEEHKQGGCMRQREEVREKIENQEKITKEKVRTRQWLWQSWSYANMTNRRREASDKMLLLCFSTRLLGHVCTELADCDTCRRQQQMVVTCLHWS